NRHADAPPQVIAAVQQEQYEPVDGHEEGGARKVEPVLRPMAGTVVGEKEQSDQDQACPARAQSDEQQPPGRVERQQGAERLDGHLTAKDQRQVGAVAEPSVARQSPLEDGYAGDRIEARATPYRARN